MVDCEAYSMYVAFVRLLAQSIAPVDVRNMLQHVTNLLRELLVGGGEANGNLR